MMATDTAAPQRIIPIRREYNRWVGNQTLEDYALRFTANSARRWSNFRVANTALGAISFLALEAIGGAITLRYGFTNAVWAILSVSVLIFLTGLPISYYAAKYGVDMDLLTRGAGFGYIGSTITSLIYASFTFIFFAIEAAIMAHALKMCLGVPLAVGYVLSALVVIPLVIHGITLISRFQVLTQPLWIVLHLLPFAFLAVASPESFSQWTHFEGRHGGDGFSVLHYGAAASVAMSLVVQIGEQVDFLRFLPRPTPQTRTRWWIALICAGPGWIVPGALKLLAGSFLAFLALQHGVPEEQAGEPTQMYLTAFSHVFASPAVALAAMGLFVVVSQLKINVTNAYAGSIAWSNFFARVTQNHPGRVVWVVFNVLIALLLTQLGIFKALETILGLYANLAIAWIGALVADLTINKPLGLSPRSIEFKRAHLYDINPVGIGAMAIAAAASMAAYAGLMGEVCQALSAFLAFGIAFAAAPLIARATRGRYYLARQPRTQWRGDALLQCCVCEHHFETQDMAHCPAYAGAICSLCCSLDARCGDVCKQRSSLHEQLSDLASRWLSPGFARAIESMLARYISLFLLATILIATIIGVVYYQEALNATPAAFALQMPLLKVFLFFTLIAGLTTWLFVLMQDSRHVAQEESRRQNLLLLQEVEAHLQTDAALKRARDVAEAANLAKSRYLSGISHELRTPLNVILGYAQLLGQDDAIPPNRRGTLKVIKRSSEHLSVLIDGLLDMAKIEAGKLVLRRDAIAFPEFIEQLVQMFELQAGAKALQLRLELPENLPAVVYADEKRLLQILINLMSNAVNYTEAGSVTLHVNYHSPIVEFEIRDTGPGIEAGDLKRIFEPFERTTAAAGTAGTGLGLTISNLLAQVMGGNISVESHPGKGSVFRVRMMLPPDESGRVAAASSARISGYRGPRRTILVVDDDPNHRMLMRDTLEPLGFRVVEAADGEQCIARIAQQPPDLLLLDISMPGIDGWEVIRRTRADDRIHLPIVIISANAFEGQHLRHGDLLSCDFLAKPVVIRQLLELLRQRLALEWTHGSVAQPRVDTSTGSALASAQIDELIALGKIGYVRGIESKLASLHRAAPAAAHLLNELGEYVKSFQLDRYLSRLQSVRSHDS